MVLTNRLKKYIRSLSLLKYRQKYNNFIAEGPKTALEFINAHKYAVETIVCTEKWYNSNSSLPDLSPEKLIICNDKDLQSVTQLKNSNSILIVISSELVDYPEIDSLHKVVYLDGIQDPGNMGTIIRIADWYGVDAVCASGDSVDFYNPKVVQAAMGSHNRVNLYASINELNNFDGYEKIAFTLDGDNLDEFNSISVRKMIVIGNEGKGARQEIIDGCDKKLAIKRIGSAESLNAAVACGIASHCIFR